MSTQTYSEIRLSRIAASPIINGIGEASDVGEPAWPRYIRITDIRGLDQLKSEDKMSLEPALAAKARVERDDILMAAVGATVGDAYIHQSDDPACFAGYLVRFRADKTLAHPRFVAYWTKSSHYGHQIRSGYVGSTIENFSASKYRAMRIPLPEVDEQREISQFLDRETAKIDALIDKQEQLISTLRDDRAATISAAITSGIDNNGHLPADRGEEHSTPAHWSETKIRHVARLNPSMKRAIEKLTDDELVTFVPMDSIGEDGSIDVNRSRPLSEVRSGYSFFERDDVLMAKVTPCFENGKLALAADLPHPCGFATTEVTVLRPTRAVYGQFLCYVLRSQTFRRASIAEMTGAGGLKRVPDNQVRNFRFRRPPLPEQRVIVQFLDDHCLKIDALIDKSTEMIATLREYRSTLITNAVTGKIDVREAM